jgi:hypothetical protein
MNAILVPTLDELEVVFEQALALCNATGAAADACPTDNLDVAADSAVTVLAEVCSAIALLPAQTASHVRLKARALLWLDYAGIEGLEPVGTSERLTRQIISALIDGVPS